MSSLYGGGGPPKAPSGYKSVANFTPDQMNLFKSLFSNVGQGSFLSKLGMGDEETFNQLEQPALKQFSGLLGGIASKYSGMGTLGGSRRSSGFQNESTQAASDFAERLQANRLGLQRQALQDLHGMSRDLLQQQPYGLIQKKKSFLESLLGESGNILSGAAQIGSLFI